MKRKKNKNKYFSTTIIPREFFNNATKVSCMIMTILNKNRIYGGYYA